MPTVGTDRQSYGRGRLFVRRVVDMYLRLARRIILALLLLTVAGMLSALFVIPLWYLSTTHRLAYNIVCAVLAAALVSAGIGRRLARLRQREGSLRAVLVQSLLPKTGKITLGVSCVALLYPVVWLFTRGHILFGLVAAIASMGLCGCLLAWRRPR